MSVPGLGNRLSDLNRIWDLPGSGGQVHLHGSPDGTVLRGGRLYPYDRSDPDAFRRLNAHEAAMADYDAEQLGLKRVDPKR